MSESKPKLKVLDLFSGILVGGFSLGLERTGHFETVAFCEIEKFPRRVLAKHWPEVPQYDDVRTLTGDILARDGISVDVITGGFPCQDLSYAGKQRGMGEGTRSGLWSEIIRLVGELRPRYVIVENVAALLAGPSERRGGWFGRVLGDLAECGYDAEWENIPASAVGAPHRRERVWLCAYPTQDRRAIGRRGDDGWLPDAPGGILIWPQSGGVRPSGSAPVVAYAQSQQNRRVFQPRMEADASASCFGGASNVPDAASKRQPRPGAYGQSVDSASCVTWEAVKPVNGGVGNIWSVEPDVGRVAHGVPDRAHRLAAIGNAVVPQIPELIGRAIARAEGLAA